MKTIEIWPELRTQIETMYDATIWQCPICLKTHICDGFHDFYCWGIIFQYGVNAKDAKERKIRFIKKYPPGECPYYYYDLDATHPQRKMLKAYCEDLI